MLISEVLFVRCHAREYHFYTVLKLLFVAIRECSLKAINVERVADELLIDVYKKLVALKCTEPVDPSKLISAGTIDSTAFHAHFI